MTEAERQAEFRKNPKEVTNKAVKGKYKFLQKYYHRGAFFVQTEEEKLYQRDFSKPTLEDHFDKTKLPPVLRVGRHSLIHFLRIDVPVHLGLIPLPPLSTYRLFHPTAIRIYQTASSAWLLVQHR